MAVSKIAGNRVSTSQLMRCAVVAFLSASLTSVFLDSLAVTRNGSLEHAKVDSRPAVAVFVLVKTVAKDVKRRHVMRSTWLQELAKLDNFEYKYFCEEPEEEYADALAEEMRLENDIVLLDGLIEQRHRKIGIKMIRSFQWIVEHRNVQHIAMADDDTYVNVATLAADFPTWLPERHYLGVHISGQPVIKVPKGTVRVGKYGEVHDFPVSKWPRYASGPFYTLSIDLVMAFVAPVLPLRDMSSNDAMTGAVLMPYANVTYADRKAGCRMWGHKLGAPCLPAETLYAFHLPPWENRPERGIYAETVAALHRNISRGDCIPGFI